MVHATQEAVDTLEQHPSLAQRRDNLKKYALQLAVDIKVARGAAKEWLQGMPEAIQASL